MVDGVVLASQHERADLQQTTVEAVGLDLAIHLDLVGHEEIVESVLNGATHLDLEVQFEQGVVDLVVVARISAENRLEFVVLDRICSAERNGAALFDVRRETRRTLLE